MLTVNQISCLFSRRCHKLFRLAPAPVIYFQNSRHDRPDGRGAYLMMTSSFRMAELLAFRAAAISTHTDAAAFHQHGRVPRPPQIRRRHFPSIAFITSITGKVGFRGSKTDLQLLSSLAKRADGEKLRHSGRLALLAIRCGGAGRVPGYSRWVVHVEQVVILARPKLRSYNTEVRNV